MSTQVNRFVSCLVLLFLFMGQQTFAMANLDYPELNVTPLASERLALEAKREGNLGLSFQWPVTISSMMVLSAGIVQTQYKDGEPDNYTPIIGIAVGTFWLATNMYLAFSYNGYKKNYDEVKKLKRKTNRQKLIRERLSEERINSMARIARKMIWASSLTNFAASVMMAGGAKEKSIGFFTDVVAAGVSLLPLVLNNRWIDVAKSQRRYKKRIYGPIIGTSWYKSKRGDLIPGVGLSFYY